MCLLRLIIIAFKPGVKGSMKGDPSVAVEKTLLYVLYNSELSTATIRIHSFSLFINLLKHVSFSCNFRCYTYLKMQWSTVFMPMR